MAPSKTPRITLRYASKTKYWKRRKSLAHCLANEEKHKEKQDQIKKAVEWCKEHNKTAYSAIQSGLFPLVKTERSIRRRLDGDIQHGAEKRYCTILTSKEEEALVKYLKNKNRACQGVTKQKLTEVILDILLIRQLEHQRSRGRRGVPLSCNASRALSTKTIGKSFWKRWDTIHKDIIKKQQGHTTVKRAVNCSYEMACKHLDDLTEELISAGIFTNAKKLKTGSWRGDIDLSIIFNHDETPQFLNYREYRFSLCRKG